MFHHHHHHHWQNSPFWAIAFLRRFCHICHPIFTSFDFATIIFYTVSSSAFASNSQSWGLKSLYVLQWQGGPVMPPASGFPSHRLLRVAVMWWRYSNLPAHNDYYNQWIENYVHGSGLGEIWCTALTFSWTCWGRPRKHRIYGLQTEICTVGLRNAKLKYFWLDHIVRLYLLSNGAATTNWELRRKCSL
jgi:hypothetical protein